ncbi:SH3 domain-containing protein [Tropicimonas sp.]|uniref:SH3 domain-containing protein n=1 Tax=Tropicimonas sp. TaxID=2067044 RepID=UPI003A8C320D
MLGRYVAGTLLILGVAMLVVPDRPRQAPPQTARANPAPPPPAPQAPAAPQEVAPLATDSAAAAEPQTPEAPEAQQPSGIEAAVAAAMQSDTGDFSPGSATVPAGDPASDDAPATRVWQGLSSISESITDPDLLSPGETDLFYVTGAEVNLRAGPSTDYGVVTTLTRGEPVELLSDPGGNWAEIRIAATGETGFMSRRFLSASPGG